MCKNSYDLVYNVITKNQLNYLIEHCGYRCVNTPQKSYKDKIKIWVKNSDKKIIIA